MSTILSLYSYEASLCKINSLDLGRFNSTTVEHRIRAKKLKFSEAKLTPIQTSMSSDVCLNRGSFSCMFLQRLLNNKMNILFHLSLVFNNVYTCMAAILSCLSWL